MNGVILVIGAVGGAGASTVAAGVALARAGAGQPTTLIDLDLEHGDLAAEWGCPERRGLADLLPVADELAAGHLGQVTFPHRSGVGVIAAPRRPGAADPWDDARLRRVIDLAGARGPLAIDGGVALSRPAWAVAGAADRVLIVTPGTVRAARRAREAAGHLGGRAATAIVVRDGAGAELGAQEIAGLVGVPLAGRIPRSGAGARRVLGGGWPLRTAPRFARALAELAGQ